MPMIPCPACSQKIDLHAPMCPKCGAFITGKERNEIAGKQKIKIFMGLLIGVTLVVLVLNYSSGNKLLVDKIPNPNDIIEEPGDSASGNFMSTIVEFVTDIFSADPPEPEVAEAPLSTDAPKIVGTPQPYNILLDTVQRKYTRIIDGKVAKVRATRHLIIGLEKGPDGFIKEGLSHEDLIETVVAAAKKYYRKDDPAPILDVKVMAGNSKSFHSLVVLACAMYIPDRKGFSGNGTRETWALLQAADRGFNKEEQRYLTLWGDVLRESKSFVGSTEEAYDTHDSAVSKLMNIPPKSLRPFDLTLRDYPME